MCGAFVCVCVRVGTKKKKQKYFFYFYKIAGRGHGGQTNLLEFINFTSCDHYFVHVLRLRETLPIVRKVPLLKYTNGHVQCVRNFSKQNKEKNKKKRNLGKENLKKKEPLRGDRSSPARVAPLNVSTTLK